jgi:2-polyprenyl-3-methyl-5-hydroxy-6-metoxy-1,4-benzoquinol methylase
MTIQGKGQSYGQTRQSWIDKLTIKQRMYQMLQMLGVVELSKNDKKNVLEFGCGYHGNNLIELIKHYPGFQCLGIDMVVNPDPSIKNITLLADDVTTWQPKNTFGIVLSLAVIEHLPDPAQHLQLISRALKPGGIAVLSSPTPDAHGLWLLLGRLRMIDTSAGNVHMLYLTQQGVNSLAEQTGLRIIRRKLYELGLNQIVLMEKPA